MTYQASVMPADILTVTVGQYIKRWRKKISEDVVVEAGDGSVADSKGLAEQVGSLEVEAG